MLEISELPLVPSTDANASMTLLDDETLIRRTVLPGGVRVLSQQVPAQRSVSLSVWSPVGSRDEAEAEAGSAHFLEHLLFKGTKTRTAQDIAHSFDEVGGESNAGTTKEFTYYWARILREDMPMAVTVLMDMLTSSILDKDEFERERGVILDELAMGNDDPMEVVHENFSLAVFGEHPLGRPIGGSVETVSATPRESVMGYYRDKYRSDSLVVVAAGAVDHDELCDLVAASLQTAGWSADPGKAPERPRPIGATGELPVYESREVVKEKPGEQAHLIIGGRGLTANDERRPAMSVLLGILGGSMSSRLFQEIRERRGLAYTTYAFDTAYTDAGHFGMYAGCAPAHLDTVEKLMRQQLEDLAGGGVTQQEIERVQGQLRGGLALGLEDSGARMNRLGRAEVIHSRFTPLEITLRNINSITRDDVATMAQYLLDQPQCKSVVVPSK
ncbi:MAG: pitrilysin family protein [Actinomycetaceae bacterium]|nr:pitrilysin family protein [Actinomycetaceae bacterium]